MNETGSHAAAQVAREAAVETVCGILERFEWIVEILGRLNREATPSPGDEDLRHGCQRALTSMLAALSRIRPAPPGKACKAEKSIRRVLNTKGADQCVDRDQFERLEQLVNRILGGN